MLLWIHESVKIHNSAFIFCLHVTAFMVMSPYNHRMSLETISSLNWHNLPVHTDCPNMVPTSEQFCLYIKIMKEGPTFPHLCTVSDKNSEHPESTGGTGQTCSVFSSFRFCRRCYRALSNSSEISLRVEYSVGGWDSAFVSQPAEWWEPGTRQPKMVCYFYHSVFNLRAAL